MYIGTDKSALTHFEEDVKVDGGIFSAQAVLNATGQGVSATSGQAQALYNQPKRLVKLHANIYEKEGRRFSAIAAVKTLPAASQFASALEKVMVHNEKAIEKGAIPGDADHKAAFKALPSGMLGGLIASMQRHMEMHDAQNPTTPSQFQGLGTPDEVSF